MISPFLIIIALSHIFSNSPNKWLEINTVIFFSLLEKIKETGEVGIYFLDIDLKTDMTGLTLAQEIRKYDPRGFIIFITTHSEMSYMTFIYKLEALDFILKDDPEELGKIIL